MYKGKLHPATLPFQGIRIEVNNELGVLQELFESIEQTNLNDTLIAIISFHSLEDRIVKNYFKKWSQKCICPSHVMRCECGNNNQKGKILTKKPIIPTKEEIKQNPRSRSSKMRIFHWKS
jgi:16S rRNA (cytosine1402-N4)-methyltransferase